MVFIKLGEGTKPRINIPHCKKGQLQGSELIRCHELERMGRCPKQQWWLAEVTAFSPGWESSQHRLGCCLLWQRGAWLMGPDQGKMRTSHHFAYDKLEGRGIREQKGRQMCWGTIRFMYCIFTHACKCI